MLPRDKPPISIELGLVANFSFVDPDVNHIVSV